MENELKQFLEHRFKSVEDKLDVNTKHLDNVNVKLHNHIEHFAFQLSGVQKDIEWIKKGSPNNQQIDNQQNANIEWNNWFIRALITAGISAMVAIITAVILRSS